MKKQMPKVYKEVFLVLTGTIFLKFEILNENLKNIFRNFIPSRTIKCNYQQPQWMTNIIKDKLKKQSKLTKIYFKNGTTEND